MRARALGVRDDMKLMGVVNFASTPGCDTLNLLQIALDLSTSSPSLAGTL